MSPKREKDREYKDLVRYPNGTYYLRYWSSLKERDIEKSLGTKIRAKALRERKRLIESMVNELDRDALEMKTFAQLVRAFLRDTTWKAPATQQVALNQINNHLLPYFGTWAPSRIDNNAWAKYVEALRSGGEIRSTLNSRKYLMKVMNWAHSKGYIKLRPKFEDFDAEKRSVGRVVKLSEFLAIREHLPDRWKDIADIAWNMGMRIGEIKGLSWDRIDLNTGVITLHPEHTKTRKGRKPVAPKVVLDLLKARKADSNSEWVFPAPHDKTKQMTTKDKPWQDAKLKAGVECRFHDLRHTWLTNTFKASNRYAEICEYAGLNIDMALKVYVKFTYADMKAVSEVLLGKTGEEK